MDKAQPDRISLQRNVILGLLLTLAAAAWAVLVWQHADATMDMTSSVTLGPRVPLFLVIWVGHDGGNDVSDRRAHDPHFP